MLFNTLLRSSGFLFRRCGKHLVPRAPVCSAHTYPQQVVKINLKDKEENVTIRKMEAKDFNNVVDLVNTRKMIDFAESDISILLKDDGKSFGTVAESEAGEIIGFSMSYLFLDPLTFSGGYGIVHEEYQRSRVGMAVIRHLMDVGLKGGICYGYGYTRLAEYYPRFGLKFHESWTKFHIWEGKFSEDMILLTDVDDGSVALHLNFDSINYEDFIDYDTSVHKFKRADVLLEMCRLPTVRPIIAVRGAKICGYALIRNCYLGHFKIAPLFADSEQVALMLLNKASEIIPRGRPVTYSTTENNSGLAAHMGSQFTKISELYRLIPKEVVSAHEDYSKVFCLTNLTYAMF